MIVYDRFYGKTLNTESESLPREIQLGRYYFLDGPYQGKDLTCRLYGKTKDHLYYQEILADDFACDVLRNIDRKSREPNFVSVPFLQGIYERLDHTTFEKKLFQKLNDIKHICINPTYMLNREVQKVNIGKAKRISYRGYEYLASHTEDWNYKSVVSFKPNRVLSEVLEEDINIYENKLLVTFVYRAIEVIKRRIQVATTIKASLDEYLKLLRESADCKMHYKKWERNIFLFASAYGYKGNIGLIDTSHTIVSNTLNTLTMAYEKLLKYTSCPIFNEIHVQRNQKIEFHETNILSNDKHYRSLRMLWKELDKIDKEKTEEENVIYEQDVIDSIRSYCLSLICFTCINYLGYKDLMGNTHEWKSTHPYLPQIHVSKNEHEIININIGSQPTIELIVSCTDKYIDTNQLNDNQYILAYGDVINDKKIISLNVKQADSTERIGTIIREYIIREFVTIIHRKHKLKLSGIINYCDMIKQSFMSPISSEEYRFIDYPEPIIIDKFEQDFDDSPITFELSKKKHTDWKNTKKTANKVYVNTAYDKAKESVLMAAETINIHIKHFCSSLLCPCCGQQYDRYNIQELSTFRCTNGECDFILKIENDGNAKLYRRSMKSGLKNLEEYYGMDYIEVRDW